MGIHEITLLTILAPLLGAAVTGLGCRCWTKQAAHTMTIAGVFVSMLGAFYLANWTLLAHPGFHDTWTVYTWANVGSAHFDVGFLLDGLSAIMLVVVTFVSLLVHIYSIGYMQEDPSYPRFFAYMSLFTFSMLCLVLGNNFLVLFFGWEGVGLVSYLLIGFWFKKDAAAEGSLKAFLINRVGDFGFLIGIALLLQYTGGIDYATVFAQAPHLAGQVVSLIPGVTWSLPTVICLSLFVGAMGKSAQVPLHVWLPESMEGPTPISALIHAATMVTAGVYMVARMSPLFELSDVALTSIMVIGATGALLMGLVGIVQHDIKRVIAYSTMSQLGYMMAANGASAYVLGIFHLTTHAFFKALLFLAAGSVIMGMHHDQDLRHMGNLKRYMPWTYAVFLIGTLALVALPPFAGYFSKDAIIEAVALSSLPGAGYAYVCLVLGAFVTSFYSFRVLFLAFHGKERMSTHQREALHESPWIVRVPLLLLALPSVIVGALLIEPMVFGHESFLSHGEISVLPQHDVMVLLHHHFHGVWHAILAAPEGPAFWATLLGLGFAWVAYIKAPALPCQLAASCEGLYQIILNKFGFDWFYHQVIVRNAQCLSQQLYKQLDMQVIDGFFVNGTGRAVGYVSGVMRRLQTGYVYHYALVMLLGLVTLVIWFMLRHFHLG